MVTFAFQFFTNWIVGKHHSSSVEKPIAATVCLRGGINGLIKHYVLQIAQYT